MAAELKLLPCPFCGSVEIDIEREGTNRVSCIMRCLNCGCYMESNETGHGEAWNRRPKIKDNLQTSNNNTRDKICPHFKKIYSVSEESAGEFGISICTCDGQTSPVA